MMAIECVMNIGSMTGLLPITGVTLPFISHGGSALVMVMAGMGLVAGLPSRQQAGRSHSHQPTLGKDALHARV